MSDDTTTTCPALHILVGAMGTDPDGNPRLPQCQPDHTGRCRHCHVLEEGR